ncbi:MAG: TIGR02281 family clan AA aspartic protease [Pseudomonadota bacterium]
MSLDNINSADLPHLVYLSLLLAMLVGSIVFKSHLKTSEILKQIVMWLIIILIILVFYSFRYDFYQIKARVFGELFPSKIVQISPQQIAIAIANDGHFYLDMKINSKPIRFMIDTGASDITLSKSDAKKVGIDLNNLSTFRKYQTANGSIISGLAVVDEMEAAGIKFNNVTVSINNNDMGTSLLGMSFLSRFERYEFYQDRLVLTAKLQ